MDSLSQYLGQTPDFVSLDIWVLLINLAVGVILSGLLRRHYIKYGKALSNREVFSTNFIPLALAIILVISIVKSSLALSLGLVGALSIVRFRTPIKDPEELSYLFIVIAMGLGLGASQTIVTIVAVIFMIIVLSILSLKRNTLQSQMFFLEVEVPEGVSSSTTLKTLSTLLVDQMRHVNLERMDAQAECFLAAFSIQCDSEQNLVDVTGAIQKEWPNARVTFLDANHSPGQ